MHSKQSTTLVELLQSFSPSPVLLIPSYDLISLAHIIKLTKMCLFFITTHFSPPPLFILLRSPTSTRREVMNTVSHCPLIDTLTPQYSLLCMSFWELILCMRRRHGEIKCEKAGIVKWRHTCARTHLNVPWRRQFFDQIKLANWNCFWQWPLVEEDDGNKRKRYTHTHMGLSVIWQSDS